MKPFGEPDFRVLFEKAPAQFMVLDPDLTIIGVSDAYLAATLTERSTMVGKPLFEVFPDNPDDPNADGVRNLTASLKRVQQHRRVDTMAVQKYDIPLADGTFEVRHWSCVNSPVLDQYGRISCIIHRAEDVTEFVNANAQGTGAEAEILARSGELRELSTSLLSANEAKNEFLSRMSHELRTPLAAILGFSELLTLADLDHEKHDWASVILRSGRHLLDLVNEVLDISRIESGDLRISLEPIAIEPILTSAYEMVGPAAKARHITLHEPSVFTGSGYLIADAQRLKQIIVNLLSNAVKYNREGGEIRVDVKPLGTEQLSVSVTDTGKGIPPTSLAKLFTPFERLEAAASEIEGVGLGLALSRSLAESMGGHLIATSTVGEGSTFEIGLRRGEPAAIEGIAEEHRAVLEPMEYAHERTVLYIEDTVANVQLVEQILKARPSIRTLPAMQGTLGLELAREHHPDLILLDLHLPDINGDVVLEQLKADERTADIPVVFLSADATGQSAEPLRQAGAVDFLTKPIGVRELLTMVDELIGDPVGASAR